MKIGFPYFKYKYQSKSEEAKQEKSEGKPQGVKQRVS